MNIVLSNFHRLVLVSAFIASWFATSSTPGYACSCIALGPPEEELARSTAVFTGTVLEVYTRNKPGFSISSADPVDVTFQVETVWKGPAAKTLVASTARYGASCGYEFEAGNRYLVYANGAESGLTVSLCSRTRPISQATQDLDQLGQGKVSETGVDSGRRSLPRSVGCSAPFYGGSAGKDFSLVLILVGLVGVGLARRVK